LPCPIIVLFCSRIFLPGFSLFTPHEQARNYTHARAPAPEHAHTHTRTTSISSALSATSTFPI
jgi:hypothetical protein